MSQLIPPRNPWAHDPSGQPMDYSMPIPGILPTETLIATVMAAVDDATDDVLVETPVTPFTALTIYNVTFALVGNTWWCTFWCIGGTPGAYKLRCRWTLSDGRGSDSYVRLIVAN
jgi:hypothetical protein